MKAVLIITAIFLSISVSFSQQEGQFMQLQNNPYLLNPAAGGMTRVMQFELGMRNQWVGYGNNPTTYVLSGHSRIRLKGEKVLEDYRPEGTFQPAPEITGGEIKHIVGGMVVNENIGPFQRLNAQASYAIHMPLVREVSFGAGLSAGYSQFGINQDRVILYESDDPTYNQFLGNSSSQGTFSMNGGIVIYHPQFMVGFSTLQLLQNDVILSGVTTESVYNRHYYLMANYGFQVNDTWEVRPGIVTKFSQNTPKNIYGSVKFTYNRAAWLALGYRTAGSLTFQAGANLTKGIYIAYGYEHGVGPLQIQGNGTHEIQIGLYLGKGRNLDKELRESAKD